MRIDLDENLRSTLEKRAFEAGVSIDRYVHLMLDEQIAVDGREAVRRAELIDAWIDRMKTSDSSSGRGGRSWREFIHEGQKD